MKSFIQRYRHALIWIGIAALLPAFIRDDYYIMVLTLCWIWAILATSHNLILGYTGQASLAQGAFFGLGAYSSSLLMLRLDFSFWAALPAAVAITGVFGLAIGLVALRTSGSYFAITTLMFNIIVTTVIDKWDGLTEGGRGLMGIPSPGPIGPLVFDSRISYYYLALAALILAVLVVYQIMRSMLGKSFLAVRGNEPLARSVGIDAMKAKVTSFTISTMLAGFGGCFYAGYLGFISPESTNFMVTFTSLINVIIGGMGTLAGPIIGTVIITFLTEYFQTFVEYATLMMGLVLLLFIIYLPGGMVWGIRTIRLKYRMSRQRRMENAPVGA
ncbi:MAG: branched-chain amino acid ABC transporter permease [Pseudomonadota bacterium]